MDNPILALNRLATVRRRDPGPRRDHRRIWHWGCCGAHGRCWGELLIPTIVLLFGADIKLAGNLSLAVSLPTMIVGFTRYSRDNSFSIIQAQLPFILIMALGSIVGTFIGGQLLGLIQRLTCFPCWRRSC